MPRAQQAVRSGDPSSATVTIASGTATSTSAHVGGQVVAIIIPDTFTAADLTFLGGVTDSVMRAIWDSATTATATQRKIVSANIPTSGGRVLSLALNDWAGINYLQIVSSVNQAQDTTFTLVRAG